MLTARATSEVCRLVAADAILGLAYSVEELSDQTAEKVATPRRAKRAPIPEPPAIEAAEPVEEASDE
jgi:hypothetical protein